MNVCAMKRVFLRFGCLFLHKLLFERIGFVLVSVEGRKIAWKFVQEHWQELYDRYEGGFLLSRLVKVRKSFKFHWYSVHRR